MTLCCLPSLSDVMTSNRLYLSLQLTSLRRFPPCLSLYFSWIDPQAFLRRLFPCLSSYFSWIDPQAFLQRFLLCFSSYFFWIDPQASSWSFWRLFQHWLPYWCSLFLWVLRCCLLWSCCWSVLRCSFCWCLVLLSVAFLFWFPTQLCCSSKGSYP